MSRAADLLGVHANTVRSWTDQGLLTCLRINSRGDRRYRRQEIDRFLSGARIESRSANETRPARNRKTAAGGVTNAARSTSQITDEIAERVAGSTDFQQLVAEAALVLCSAGGYSAAAIVSSDGGVANVVGRARVDQRLVQQAVEARAPVLGRARPDVSGYRAALPVFTSVDAWQVIVLSGDTATRPPDEEGLLRAVMAQLTTALRMRGLVMSAAQGQERAELLMEISNDLGSHLDLPRILDKVVERAMALIGADHAAIFTIQPGGGIKARVSRNLSAEYCQLVEHAASRPVAAQAFDGHSIVNIPDYPDDPRGIELRHAVVHEGINTITAAPLLVDGQPLGALALYHDKRFELSDGQRALLGHLAQQAATTLRNAQNFSQMATWAAQLQSIQQLGARLTRLRTVAEIGQAIAAELNQLIDYHNVRVYRIEDDNCVPVAWRGAVGEYMGEEGAQLRVKVGQGVTGWVARYGLAQNVGDAANDRRSQTIPGTDDDLDESLLLAPMLYEDEVIGVIVLAKLGLNQFSADDLRLLEIYASIAAQAMANADSTERLRAQSEALSRQLNNQRELLRVTESILSTLDTQAVLAEIAERLKTLVQVDNMCVDLHDQRAGLLRPIFAHGTHADEYLATTTREDQGVGGYVLKTGEAQLVQDQLTDPRVFHFTSTGPEAGAMIVAPLRGADRIRGVLTIERLGVDARFAEEEFELVKLFAAHVSIALQNAEAHRAVEIRAETDRLTGLWNHGALIEHVDGLVASRTKFSMLMVDLDFFKKYNDKYGHQAGNVMLQRIAEVLRASCRETDQVFRYGGDEFVLLLLNTGIAGARTVAEKVMNAISALDPGRSSVPLTCSIGMAVYPKDGEDGASMILAADRACYAGKRGGRARIATALEGLALAEDFQPTEPTPIQLLDDSAVAEPSYSAA